MAELDETSLKPPMTKPMTVRREAGALGALPKEGGRRVWSFFSSVRVALVLILILTALSLIGTLLIQVSPEVKADPGVYADWREEIVRPKLGFWTTPLYLLGLFDVFHSPWFLGTGSLLIMSIIICSLNRWKGISDTIFNKRVRLADGFYEGGVNRAQFPNLEMTPQETGALMKSVLTRRGYRVLQEERHDSLWITGDKNRFFRLGTYLHHLAIVVVIIGYLMASYLGFRARSFAVPVGSIREVGHDTNLSLRLENFVDEWWPEGLPKDFRSDVILYENGVEVQRGTLRVNHPMSYKGVRFYQSYYGTAVAMEVRDNDGKLLYGDNVALTWTSGKKPYQRPTGVFNLPDAGITAYLLAPASTRTQGFNDPLLKGGQMRLEVYEQESKVPMAMATLDQGTPKTLLGLEFTFVRELQFSGFEVGKDPGNALIWLASTLFLLGLVMVFYFPHRQVWVRAHITQGDRTRLLVRTTSARSFAVASDFESLVETLQKELSLKEIESSIMEVKR